MDGDKMAAVLLLLSELALLPILRLLQTPDLIIHSSALYLRIMFAGIPVVMAYNLLASILRALGDGKTPLHAMIVAAGINIVLDLLFVMVFDFGIAGAAAATVIAQLCSGVYCLYFIRRIDFLDMKKEDFRWEKGMDRHLVFLGFPMAFQNAIISVGGMIVQSVVNGCGHILWVRHDYLCGTEPWSGQDRQDQKRNAVRAGYSACHRSSHRGVYASVRPCDCGLLSFRRPAGSADVILVTSYFIRMRKLKKTFCHTAL